MIHVPLFAGCILMAQNSFQAILDLGLRSKMSTEWLVSRRKTIGSMKLNGNPDTITLPLEECQDFPSNIPNWTENAKAGWNLLHSQVTGILTINAYSVTQHLCVYWLNGTGSTSPNLRCPLVTLPTHTQRLVTMQTDSGELCEDFLNWSLNF